MKVIVTPKGVEVTQDDRSAVTVSVRSSNLEELVVVELNPYNGFCHDSVNVYLYDSRIVVTQFVAPDKTP